MLKDHFPYAVAALFVALASSGHATLAILEVAFALALLPVVYARDADDTPARGRDDD